ncbi:MULTISPECIES: hypothetical protein [unclassified Agromyces]|uniref:hypothetical protein n=1 Tax=unclassified Agromyces TaxID=2639701 RepID=UPI003014BD4B
MAGKGYELAVQGMPVPDGQIPFAELGALATSIQDLVLRIGRQLDERSGAGRTPLSLGRATEVRLVALREGSTLLDFEIGDPDTIDLPDETHALLAERFEEIVQHVQINEPPPWTDHLVGEAAGRVVASLRSLGASSVTLSRTAAERVPVASLEPLALDPAVWAIEPPALSEATLVQVQASGVLEAVDLRSHRFRVRDDTGRGIALENVADAEEVARLVGSRVIAHGAAHRDARGMLAKIEGASIVPQGDVSVSDDLPLVRGRYGPIEPAGLSDDELDAFLRDIRS